MTGRALRWTLAAAFAVALGHLAWHAVFGPPTVPKYFVGGDVTAMTGPDAGAKQLYLRRDLYLPQNPRTAWVQLLARDRVRLYVNGRYVGAQILDGFPVALVIDLAPYLNAGHNVLAVAVTQTSIGKPPVVAVEGAYTLSDGEHRLGSDESWRCSPTFERGASWWFTREFKDRHWPTVRLAPCYLRASTSIPPRAVTAPAAGRWITPPALEGGCAAVRRDFEVEGRPREAWLRVKATSSYRLAVNGILLDQQEDQLGTDIPVPPVQWTYDLTPVVRPGPNVVSFVLSATSGPPHLFADLEVEDASGRRTTLGTDEQWLARPGLPPDWLRPASDDPAAWGPCYRESGDLTIMPWEPRRQSLELSLPPNVVAWRTAWLIGLILATFLVTLTACRLAAWLLRAPAGAPYLALLLPTLAIACGVLATYDPRVARSDVYREIWVLLAAASVPLQWALLALLPLLKDEGGRMKDETDRSLFHPSSFLLHPCLMAGLLAVGFWLRWRDLAAEPLHPDEVTVYRIAHGFRERGFPSIEVHKDLPPLYLSGSELSHCGSALCSLIFREDVYVVRVPPLFWGMLTIVLIGWVGRRMFSPAVGLIAAVLYTFSTPCIQMTNFGRYPSQLQFLTLLTVYFFWRIIAGAGPIDRRALWLTAFSFIAMFLTWEASALIAPGMILAALVQRRGRLGTLFGEPHLYAAVAVVGLAVSLQYSHRTLQQSQFMWYGTGATDVSLMPMWPYPFFRPLYYLWASSWSKDSFLPMLGFLGGCLLTVQHGFRRQLRVLLLIFVVTCLVQAALLSVVAGRYAYHLVPLVILPASAALAAGVRALTRLRRREGIRAGWRAYGCAVGLLATALLLALGSGLTVELTEMTQFVVNGPRLGRIKYPNLAGPVQYLREHYQEGDLVLAIHPYVVNHLVARAGGDAFGPGLLMDYWLESTLQLQAILDDRRPLPLHRYCGTVMVSSREDLKVLFARHRRVWYFTIPSMNDKCNDADVSAFLRQNADVVYEDSWSLLLLKDSNHRQASQRREDERALLEANANFLP